MSPRELIPGRASPNLFIVGLPKAATTLLHNLLDQHPDICMSRPKELYYFDRDFTDFSRNRKTRYLALDRAGYTNGFAHWRGESVIGEASPTYIFSEQAAKEIAEFGTDTRVLIVLREPVAFLYSLHAHLVRNPASSGEPLYSFRRALEAEQFRVRGLKIPPGHVRPGILHYSRLVQYDEHVGRYHHWMGKDRTMVVLFEELIGSTQAVLGEILRFVGVEPMFPSDVQVINRGREIRSGSLKKLKDKLSSGGKCWQISNRAAKVLLRNRLVGRAASKAAYRATRPIDPELKEILRLRFQREVGSIAKLLDRDLERVWGY